MKKSDVIHIYTGTYSNKAFDILNRLHNYITCVNREEAYWSEFSIAKPIIHYNKEVIWEINIGKIDTNYTPKNHRI